MRPNNQAEAASRLGLIQVLGQAQTFLLIRTQGKLYVEEWRQIDWSLRSCVQLMAHRPVLARPNSNISTYLRRRGCLGTSTCPHRQGRIPIRSCRPYWIGCCGLGLATRYFNFNRDFATRSGIRWNGFN